MAGDAVVGALRVVLGLDTASYEDGAKRASDVLARFGKSMSGMSTSVIATGNIIASAFEKIAGSVASSMKAAIDNIDNLGKIAQKAGVPVEEFSQLAFSASKVRIGVEDLGNAFEKLGRNISETLGGNRGSEAARAFEVLGISLRTSSGEAKSSQDVFRALATQFANFQDSPQKTALAMAIFGKAGADMIPILNQGTAALDKQAAEMENLGLVINDKTRKAAEQFNKEWNSLGKILESVTVRITVAFLPALQTLTAQFADAAKQTKNWEGTTFVIDAAVKVLTSAVVILSALFGEMIERIGLVAKAVSLLAGGEFKQAWETLATTGPNAVDTFKGAMDRLSAIWVKGKKDGIDYAEIISVVEDNLQAISKVQLKAPDLPSKSFGQAIDDIKTKTLEAQGVFNQFPPTLVETAKSLGLIQGSGAQLTPMLIANNAQLTILSTRLAELKQAQITAEFITPWQLFNQEIIKLNAAFPGLAANTEAYMLKTIKLSAQMAQSYGETAAAIVTPMASAFKTIAELNNKYAGIAKAAAIGEAVVNTYLAATKALATVPFPFNFAAAAAVTAAGIANVAKIVATPFAQGGKFKVGGVGGIDSQLVQFKATPGEMVDIRKPGATTTTSEITVNMRGRDLVSKDMIRDLFNALNEGTRDGYRLKLAEA